jgi:hypothetical protein
VKIITICSADRERRRLNRFFRFCGSDWGKGSKGGGWEGALFAGGWFFGGAIRRGVFFLLGGGGHPPPFLYSAGPQVTISLACLSTAISPSFTKLYLKIKFPAQSRYFGSQMKFVVYR